MDIAQNMLLDVIIYSIARSLVQNIFPNQSSTVDSSTKSRLWTTIFKIFFKTTFLSILR